MKIKVGPFEYSVKFDKVVANEGSVFGTTHNNDQLIVLDPDKPDQKIDQTLVHELLHACMFISGLTYRFTDKEPVSEEDVCRELSIVLYQVLKDNPGVFEYKSIIKSLKEKYG